MLDWLSWSSFLFTAMRIGFTWLFFLGVGAPLKRTPAIKKLFPNMPAVVFGMIASCLAAAVLSGFGVMNRTVLLIIMVPGALLALPETVTGYNRIRKAVNQFSAAEWVASIAFFLVSLTSLMFASVPNVQFDDPLIIYAVRPDLWLNAGRIFWISETYFSGFPFLAELISVFPAALTQNRVDQLSVLQVFQFSMLLASVFSGFRLMKLKERSFPPAAVCIVHVSILSIFCAYAKTDVTCMFFVTIAFCSVFREIKEKVNRFDLTPYAALGLAFTAKLTSALFLVPFAFFAFIHLRSNYSLKHVFTALAAIFLVPVVFGTITMLKTGSPTYPILPVESMLKDDYELLEKPEEIRRGNDRSILYPGSGLQYNMKQIATFFFSMEGVFLLFLSAIIVVLRRRKREFLFFIPVLVFSVIAIKLYWPPWWGAKYTIQLYPFIGLMSVYYLEKEMRKHRSMLLYSVTLVGVVIPGFVIAPALRFPETIRVSILDSFTKENWNNQLTGMPALYFQSPEVMTHLWMNEIIPEGSVILSLHQEKRYFSDNPVIVAWRNPQTLPLFDENTLEEEISILQDAGVNYVTFYRNDPVPFELENKIRILDRIGTGDILEPVHMIQEYLICRFNPEALQ